MSESDKNIYQRILAVMADTGSFSKDGRNTFHNYKYASVESIVSALHPALIKHGVMLMHTVVACEQVQVRQFTQKGGWGENEVTRVTVVTTAVNVDKPEEKVEQQTYGFGLDGQDKGVYKAISGARKYGIFGLFNLMAGDDDPESTRERTSRRDETEPAEVDSDFLK